MIFHLQYFINKFVDEHHLHFKWKFLKTFQPYEDLNINIWAVWSDSFEGGILSFSTWNM